MNKTNKPPYKLIKEYPGSPALHTEIKYTGNGWRCNTTDFAFYDNPKQYTEYWQEVKEKEYEILSFMNEYSSVFYLLENGNFFHSLNGNYGTHPKVPGTSLEEMLSEEYISIYSVKRLSDGEVFTVGDKINDEYTISNFKIGACSDILVYVNEGGRGWVSFKTLYHSKQPLFTTEDGVDIFEGNYFIPVSLTGKYGFKPFELCIQKWTTRAHDLTAFKYFSTHQAAEQWIKENKPVFSKTEMLEMFDEYKNHAFATFENIIDDHLAKKYPL